MIWTLTLNPSLDYLLRVEDFKIGKTNRAKSENLFPAGKGINVSLMLKNLGIESVALGFLAGFSGEEIKKRLDNFGLKSDFIFLKEGFSRINIKISSNDESEINAKGPKINQEDLNLLFSQLERIKSGDILVLSGSLLDGMSFDFYSSVMQRFEKKGVEIVLDCSGKAMLEALKMKPFLIKPNKAELEELFKIEHIPPQEIGFFASKLQDMGARNVLVSMAGDGAFLLQENGKTSFSQAPKGEVKNSVGAGDSMVAGFLAGIAFGYCYEDAFLYSVASGSASAFLEGFADKKQVEMIFKLLKEEK